MKGHETWLASEALGPWIEDIKPVVQAGGSDTAVLDNVFELLVRAGRDAPMAKAPMIPASIGQTPQCLRCTATCSGTATT
jgi:glutamate synthase (NADPH) large chain